jgi:hypothetical protein
MISQKILKSFLLNMSIFGIVHLLKRLLSFRRVKMSSENIIHNRSCTLIIALLTCLFVCFLASPAQARLYNGSGTEGEPFVIYTAAEMNDIGNNLNDWDKHFKLMANINLAGYSESNFNLIGIDWVDFFSGIFDGNGHTISNFTYSFTEPFYGGLFRYVSGSSAEIKNLTLIDPNTNAGTSDISGILIGRMLSGATVSNCHIQGGHIVANYGNGAIGGLVGSSSANISDCSAQVHVTGYGNTGGTVGLGGLVGHNYGTITNCYVVGTIDGNDYYAGGLVGMNDGTISHCYASASVEGTRYAGGLIGSNWGTISDCNAAGSVTGTWSVGGLVGFNWGSIERCHSHTNVIGNEEVGGFAGASYLGSISDCHATGDVLGGINGDDEVGGFIGRSSDPISNCHADCNVWGADYVGGFVGENSNTLTNCYSAGSVSGNERVGGLIGENHSTVSGCYSSGAIVQGEKYIGGLVGLNITGTAISNCYSSQNVSCTWLGGGLVARNDGTVTNCYSVGSVSGMFIGGLISGNYGTVENSFWDTETALPAQGSDGGTGLQTYEMQMESTFTDAGWDFIWEDTNGSDDIWAICDTVDYPKLTWQFTIGDFDGDDDVDFADFAAFAMHWRGADSVFPCGGTDLTGDEQTGLDDLKQFIDNWLAGVE